MKFQPKESEFKLMLNNAITWFDELVRINGCQCSTSTFIHNMLVKVYGETMTDGKMLWDRDLVEKAYPQVVDDIREEEREKIYTVLRHDLEDFIKRRLKDG